MAVLSIIGCRMMEDEIVHVVGSDPSVTRLMVIENGNHHSIVRKFEYHGFDVEVVRNLPMRSSTGDGLTVIVSLQRIALHLNPNRLARETYANVRKYATFSDGVLLFYGQCGNAFGDLESFSEKCGCSIRTLNDNVSADGAGQVVDCISAAVAGNDNYNSLIRQYPSAMFFTPMWSSNWRSLFKAGKKSEYNLEASASYFNRCGINKLIKIDTGLSYEGEFHNNVDTFVKKFDFDVIEVKGSVHIAESSYTSIKADMSLSGSLRVRQPPLFYQKVC